MTLRTDRTGEDTEPPGLPAEITAADVLRLVMRDGDKRLRRFAVDIDSGRVSLHFEPADGEDDLPTTAQPALKEIERDILRVLRESGRRMKAIDIARVIDPDEDAYDGTFTRAIRRLKRLGMIEGGRSEGGYRLKAK